MPNLYCDLSAAGTGRQCFVMSILSFSVLSLVTFSTILLLASLLTDILVICLFGQTGGSGGTNSAGVVTAKRPKNRKDLNLDGNAFN